MREATHDDVQEHLHHVDLNAENTNPAFGTAGNKDTARNDDDDHILSSTNVNGRDVDKRYASILPNNGPIDMHDSHSEAFVGRVLNIVHETTVLEVRAFVDDDKGNAEEVLADARIYDMDRIDPTPSEHKSTLLEGIASDRAVDDKLRTSPTLVAVNKNDADIPSSFDEADPLYQDQTFDADFQKDTCFGLEDTKRDEIRSPLNVDNNNLADLKFAHNLDGVISGDSDADALEDRDFDADVKEEIGSGDFNKKFSDAILKTENNNESSGNVVIAGTQDENE